MIAVQLTVGIGSNSDDFDADFITFFLTSSIEAGDRTVIASPLNLTSVLKERPFNLKGGLWFFSKKIF
jgi:hypothetical protein